MAIVTPGDSNLGRNSGTNLSGNSIPPRGQGDIYLDKGIENDLAACYKNLVNYGILLPSYGLQWRDEVLNLLSSSNTNKIAEFDELSMNVIMDVRNSELASSGQKYKLNCSGYLFKDYCNNITSINYSGVSTFNISLAKFTFGGLPGEWYVRNGQLCKLDIVSSFDGRSPDLGDNPNPPPVQNPPPAPAPLLGSGQCYVPLYSDDVLENEEIITQGMWFTGSVFITDGTHQTAALMKNHRYNLIGDIQTIATASNYILDVYNFNLDDDPLNTCSHKIQYKIIYADYEGKGDIDLGGKDSETMTKAMYTQYANILLPKGQNKFIIDGTEQDYVYIIDVERERYNTEMDPGNWEISFVEMDYYFDTGNTGSSNFTQILSADYNDPYAYNYIDNSVGHDVILTNKSYDIAPGNLETGLQYEMGLNNIGLFYPNHGMLVLSGTKLDDLLGFRTNRNIQVNGFNTARLMRCLEKVDTADASGDYYGFKARSVIKKYNKMYFIRVKNQQLNYSNNPSYQISGSNGTIISDFRGIEKAYFTTIGLYNSNKELLAVGKLSKALMSSSDEESLLTVKISI